MVKTMVRATSMVEALLTVTRAIPTTTTVTSMDLGTLPQAVATGRVPRPRATRATPARLRGGATGRVPRPRATRATPARLRAADPGRGPCRRAKRGDRAQRKAGVVGGGPIP